MKAFVCALLAVVLSIPLCANDGVYMSSGGAFYPIQETRISMQSEILSFKVRNRVAIVNIQFEFFNPDSSPRTLLVGFQAPVPSGDLPDSVVRMSHISDFRVMQGGQLLPYQQKIAECASCELLDLSEMESLEYGPGVYVYLFELTFQPGVTTINHSYNFKASGEIFTEQKYNYILTTGSKWAGGKIGSLTVEFDLGENQYFYVDDAFGAEAEWKIVGSGNISQPQSSDYFYRDAKMIRILSGHLQVSVSNHSPTENINFGIFSTRSFICHTLNYEELEAGEVFAFFDPYYRNALDDPDVTSKELRLLRNTVFAQHGYAFKSEDLQVYFSQFPWYIPDPNLKMEDIELSEWEQEYVRKIQAMEAEK